MDLINKKYDEALVIFIDILGSQNRTDFETLYEINDTFHGLLLDNEKYDKEYTIYKRTICTFSDCAYIIYDYKEGIPEEKKSLGKLIEVALCNCEPILIQFLNKKFVFRGGIAYGNVYYEKERNILFGPGINAAYQLENKVAVYPRIVVEERVAEIFLKQWNEIVSQMDNPQNENDKLILNLFGNFKKLQGCIVKKDFDGIYMMHYLNSIQMNQENIAFTDKYNYEFIEDLQEYCKEQIEVNRENLYVVQKYGWLLQYIESVFV